MGTLMLDDILSVMNAGGIRTQRAYPGKPMPQVEETVAAVSLQKADLTTGETQIKVLVLSHSRMGAGACEDTAMAAARALKSAGYSCQVDSVEFDGRSGLFCTAIVVSNPVDKRLKSFKIGAVPQQHVISFTAQRMLEEPETDLEKAEFYFRKAADLNNIDALYGLGKLHLNKSYDGYDPQKAVAFLIEAAKQDHEFAQYTLGKLFLKGEAVPKNISYALRWLEEAASKGNPYAEYLLGKTLLLGDDVDRDSDRGEALLKKSADNGNVYAAYTLGKALLEGNHLLQDVPEALRLITQAADGGFSSAQYLLGKLLYRGEVTAQDVPKALSYLENASVQDHPYAAYLAGKILLTEEAVKDIPKAIRYFEIASDAGNNFAEYQLGKLYLYGKEVSQDYEKAMEYLSSSASHGNQYAGQLLHSIQSNHNCSAALGTLRLFHHLSQMIQKRIEDESKYRAAAIDRKLKRIIDEKKQAHGLKQG